MKLFVSQLLLLLLLLLMLLLCCTLFLKYDAVMGNEFALSSGALCVYGERPYTVHNLLADLKSCSMRRDIEWGRTIHVRAVESRHDSSMYVVMALIKMYAKCGSMVDAQSVFDSIQKPDVVLWTALLSGYAENGDGLTNLQLFSKMKASGCAPDSVTYIAALKACAVLAGKRASGQYECLERGKLVHAVIGCDLNLFVQNTLIDMYAKCGSMAQSHSVFDSIRKPDVVSWNALLLGYVDNGDGITSLDLFFKMKSCSCVPNSVTHVAALKACTSLAVKRNGSEQAECLKRGKEMHSEIGSNLNIFVKNTLIDMYAKCGSMVDAHLVFNSIKNPDVVSWTTLLLGYAESGDGLYSLELFSRMKALGCAPNSITYVSALKACTSLAGKDNAQGECLKQGRLIHSEIGSDLDNFIQNSLIDMYSKSGSMAEARRVFDSIINPDVVSWNALLCGYVENGDGLAALEMFSRLKGAPNFVTYIAALKACTTLAEKQHGGGQTECLEQGRKIHLDIRNSLDISVQSTLIDMYAKCGSIVEARRVFDSIETPDVVCWTAMILGYAEHGDGLTTLELFSRMKACGCSPDCVTYIAVLKACTCVDGKRDGGGPGEWLELGRKIHSTISCNPEICVQNTLIDMYSKCGSMVEARSVFDSIGRPSVVSWNALLMGYAGNGGGVSTLELFSEMKARGCAPDSLTYVSALKACTYLAGKRNGGGQDECLKLGREIHSEICCDLNILLQSTLIDMYANCGSMMDAHRVFDSIQNPDVVSWTALLLGYANNGDAFSALELVSKMKACGCIPDSVTYVAALKACGQIGALALGRMFHLEISDFSANVVTCLVDFYAKCGSLSEACEVFDLHPTARVVSTWNALLAGHSSFGDTTSVFNLFRAMGDQGFQPDSVTFLCMLSCCSHAGLAGKARQYFEEMPVQYGLIPSVMHYNCMVDILGRGNQLNEALAMLQNMPCTLNAVSWMTLLGACCKWKNVDIGTCAFLSLMEIDNKNTPAYVLMAHIYGSRGMWEEQERVLERRAKLDT